MSSDSDSDLEFLAGYRGSHPPARQQSRASAEHAPKSVPSHAPQNQHDLGSAKLEAEYWEKLGENEILRSQLNKTEAEYQRNLSELVAKQLSDKEDHKKELEEVKRALARERIQHEFLLIELRAKNPGQQPAAPASGHPTPHSTAATQAAHPHSVHASTDPPVGSNTRRRSAINAFNDGFSLKKPKLAPTSSLASQPQAATPNRSQTPDPSLKNVAQPLYEADSSRLMAFLIAHHAPGFVDNSLQVLFSYKTSAHTSVGQQLSKSLSLSEFVTTIVGHIETFGARLDNDAAALLLSLLYDSLFLELPLSLDQNEISLRFCNLLIGWAKDLAPLPSFGDLEALNRLRLQQARLFTCVMYTLDVLLALDWEYEVPFELCRRVLSMSQAPQVYARCIDLMAAHPQLDFASLLSFEFPSTPAEPTVELLFGGLADGTKLTVVELSRRSEHRSKFCALAPRVSDIRDLKERSRHEATSVFRYIQSASIRLADALIRIGAPAAAIDRHVLSLLLSTVDTYTIFRDNAVTEHCVFYFWCRDSSALKESLGANGTAEICICLTKLVYQRGTDDSDVTNQSRQLLGFLGNSDENDRLDSTFVPMDTLRASLDDEDAMADI